MINELYKNQIDIKDLPEDAIILDVRNGSEHSDIALKRKHYFVELPSFDAKDFVRQYSLQGEKIYVLCQSGVRATKAAQKLEDFGYKNVAIIKGGMAEVAKNPELVKRRSVMSIERQVRIVAGSLVALGGLLSFINPYFALLSVFVGCGLIYAGISNSCVMAQVLMKLPWNRS